MSSIMKGLVKSMHFCCMWAFIKSVRGRTHPMVADRMGVHEETIDYWRKKVRRGTCECTNAEGCAKKRFGLPIPRVDLSVLKSGVRDPFI